MRERVERGVALANSKLAKCQSKICRSLDDRYTSLWEKKGSDMVMYTDSYSPIRGTGLLMHELKKLKSN